MGHHLLYNMNRTKEVEQHDEAMLAFLVTFDREGSLEKTIPEEQQFLCLIRKSLESVPLGHLNQINQTRSRL